MKKIVTDQQKKHECNGPYYLFNRKITDMHSKIYLRVYNKSKEGRQICPYLKIKHKAGT